MKWRTIAAIALVLPSFAARSAGQDRLGTLRERFQTERDPVRQAKSFPKLGDALLEEMRQQADGGNVPEAKATLEEYRDDLKHAVASLKASGRNAEKQPGGFKELQIYLRKAVPRMEQIVLQVPFEQREPFDATRREVAAVDEALFHLLFPRQPAPQAGGRPQQ